jgi:hypothetical protein
MAGKAGLSIAYSNQKTGARLNLKIGLIFCILTLIMAQTNLDNSKTEQVKSRIESHLPQRNQIELLCVIILFSSVLQLLYFEYRQPLAIQITTNRLFKSTK